MNIDDGMLNDRCDDDSSCSVIGGFCDGQLQRCLCRHGYAMKNHFKCLKASTLGEICLFDKQCQMSDTNSHCVPAHDHNYHLVYRCTCKSSYNVEVINSTERCIYLPDSEEPDFEDLTAAPIILCFVGCIVIEIVCLLGFRYWKKHRMETVFQRREIDFGNTTSQRLENVHSNPLPVVTFSITHPPNPVISGACVTTTTSSSPPPYTRSHMTQTSQLPSCSSSINHQEDVLPTYEEAVKLTVSIRTVDESNDSDMKCHTYTP